MLKLMPPKPCPNVPTQDSPVAFGWERGGVGDGSRSDEGRAKIGWNDVGKRGWMALDAARATR